MESDVDTDVDVELSGELVSMLLFLKCGLDQNTQGNNFNHPKNTQDKKRSPNSQTHRIFDPRSVLENMIQSGCSFETS
jgi:hypothetical protein